MSTPRAAKSKWAVAAASLGLVVFGAHLAWERHRYRLETPQGTVWVGMTPADVQAVLGPALSQADYDGFTEELWGEDGLLLVDYEGGRVTEAYWYPSGAPVVRIPRPSLVEHIRSWLTRAD
jgi:hypothetical protein